jgi:hypothetical protein
MSWDKTEPSNASFLQSGDIRQGWEAIETALRQINILPNAHFRYWEDGTSAPPTQWDRSDADLTVAQESSVVEMGTYSVKLTYGTATHYFYCDAFPTDMFTAGMYGKKVSFTVKVRTANASQVRISVADGADETFSTSYHTGGDSFERLSVVHTIDNSATHVEVRVYVEDSDFAYVADPILVFGEINAIDDVGFEGGRLFDGHVLPSGSPLERCKATKSGAQTINSASVTDVVWGAEAEDLPGWHSTVSNTERITIHEDGFYFCIALLLWASDGVGIRYGKIVASSSGTLGINRYLPSTTSEQMVSGGGYLSAGEHVKLQVEQTSGGGLNLNIGSFLVVFRVL